MTRISMNLPEELLNEFDEVLEENGLIPEEKDSKMLLEKIIIKLTRFDKLKNNQSQKNETSQKTNFL